MSATGEYDSANAISTDSTDLLVAAVKLEAIGTVVLSSTCAEEEDASLNC
jgi:hypothetical protein